MTIKHLTSKAAVLPAAATAAAGTPRQPARKGITVTSRRIVIAPGVTSHPHSTVARPPNMPTGSGDVIADPTTHLGTGGGIVSW